jgi:hypothetical protein
MAKGLASFFLHHLGWTSTHLHLLEWDLIAAICSLGNLNSETSVGRFLEWGADIHKFSTEVYTHVSVISQNIQRTGFGIQLWFSKFERIISWFSRIISFSFSSSWFFHENWWFFKVFDIIRIGDSLIFEFFVFKNRNQWLSDSETFKGGSTKIQRNTQHCWRLWFCARTVCLESNPITCGCI